MTGIASRIIHSALLLDFSRASTTLSRLIAFCRFWPLPSRMSVRQLGRQRVEVETREQVLDRLGTHATAEVVAEAQLHLAVKVSSLIKS